MIEDTNDIGHLHIQQVGSVREGALSMSADPKILYIIGQLGQGGAEQQLYNLIKYLKPRAQVVSLSQGGYWADPLRELGIEVIELERRRSWDISRLAGLVRAIRAYRPEIVHIFLDNVPGLYGRLAALLCGHSGVIVGERADTALQQPYWYQLLKRLMNARVSAIVCNSKTNSHYLVSRRIVDGQKLFCIENGLELDRFVSRLESAYDVRLWPEKKNSLIVGTVGNLSPVKAPDLFVRVAARVLARYPDAQFVHVGDGPLRDEMQALSRKLGIENSIIFLGQREDVPHLLAAMDVFVFTSRSEGMPNAVMEAMATSLPCVTTDAGDCRQLVIDGETGFVVPVDDEEELAGRVLLLLEDEALRRSMGIKAQKRAATFDVREMAEQYRRLYKKVLDDQANISGGLHR